MNTNLAFAQAPEYHLATYTEQKIPQHRGNPLIEALPPSLDEDALLEKLFIMPEFSEEQRDWPIHERMQMLAQLSNFMVPLSRHLELAHSLDALMRQGYVGRIPRSAAHHRVFEQLHEQQRQKTSFQPGNSVVTAQLSSSLIGLSGMGKTTTVKRLLSHIPKVIHHPDYGIYQIPYLHIETPYDGVTVKGLAQSIFRKVDTLLPEADYTGTYGLNSRSGAETLMNHAARILHMHCVGLLVIDEIQNLENSPKNRQSLMTLLVSASNELGVPILFIGTNKARRILSLDFRQARRSIGFGLSYWDQLRKGSQDAPDEWENFADILWSYQWVQHPVDSTPELMDLLFHYSQGIVDIAIKLFAACQVRAMFNGSETITKELMAEVAAKELAMVAPMIAALRRGDVEALQAYDDIAPLNLENMLQQIAEGYSGRKVKAAAIKPENELFVPTVAESLGALGFDSDTATSIAERVAQENPSNAIEGVKKALTGSTAGRRASRPKKEKAPQTPVSYPEGDYRNALQTTGEETVHERLESQGLLTDLNQILPM